MYLLSLSLPLLGSFFFGFFVYSQQHTNMTRVGGGGGGGGGVRYLYYSLSNFDHTSLWIPPFRIEKSNFTFWD